MASLSLSYLLNLALTVALLMWSAIVHEVAHGWVALMCGDDTAKRSGRLTLKPSAHLDPVGSVVLPLLMALAGSAVFAYAKPVPYNPRRLRNPRRDEVLVALAGPASNLAQALVAALLFNLAWALLEANPAFYYAPLLPVLGCSPLALILKLLSTYLWVNLMLCFFNLIPLPPLDGSKLLMPFLTGKTLATYRMIQAYAMPVLIVVLYVFPRLGFDPVGSYLDASAGALYQLLLGA